MPTTSPNPLAHQPREPVIQWLLDSDPSICWQVMQNLTAAPAGQVAAKRARVANQD